MAGKIDMVIKGARGDESPNSDLLTMFKTL